MLKIKAIICYKNKVAKVYKIKLKENETQFSIKNGGLSFNINDSDGVLTGKRKPIMTYFYNSEDCNPINPYTKTQSLYTPAQFNKALNDKLLDKFLDLSKPALDVNIFILIFIVIILIVGGYFLFSEISNIKDALPTITTTAENIPSWE